MPSSSAERDRYSRIVGLLRVILPVLALAVLAGVFAWPMLNPKVDLLTNIETGNGKIVVEGIDYADDAIRMSNTQFSGFDEQDRPFTISAKSAVQARAATNEVAEPLMMAEPSAEVILSKQPFDWIRLRADHGRYLEAENRLELKGDVTLTKADGLRMATSAAQLDLTIREAMGSQPVIAEAPQGRIESVGFNIKQDGSLIFYGPARMIISDLDAW